MDHPEPHDLAAPCSYIALIASTAIAVGLIAVQCTFDGGNWVGSSVAAITPGFTTIGWLVLAVALLGWGTGLLARRTQRAIALGFLTSGLLVGIWGGSRDTAQVLWNSPDCARIAVTLLLATIAGGAFALATRQTKVNSLPAVGLAGICFVYPVAMTHSWGSALAVVLLILVGDACGGYIIGRLFGTEPQKQTIPRFLHVLTGWAMLVLISGLVGLAGGASRSWILGAWMVLIIIFHQRIRNSVGTTWMRLTEPRPWPLFDGLLGGAAFGIAFVVWIAALAPETGPDALGSRSALPMMWLRDGAIRSYPELLGSYMGLAGEVMHLLVLPLTGPNCAKVVSMASALVIVIALGHRSWGAKRPERILAGLCLFGSTVVWWQFVHGFVDLQQASLFLGACIATMAWRKSKDPSWAALVGLLGGAATAVKLNGGAVLLIAVCAMVPSLVGPERRRAAISLAMLTLTSMAMIGPWLLRSWLLTGNPVFPFANNYFNSPLAPLTLVAKHFGLPFDINLVTLPWKIVAEPGRFVEIGTVHTVWALLLARCVWQRCIRWEWAIIGCLVWLAWLTTEQNTRYAIPALVVTAVALVVAPPAITRYSRLELWIIAACWLLGTVLGLTRPSAWLWRANNGPAFPLDWAYGRQSTETYLQDRLPTYPLAQALLDAAGPHTRLWQVPWLRDHLYFAGESISMPHGDLRMIKPLSELLGPAGVRRTPAEIAATLQSSRITHVLFTVENPWIKNLPENAWQGFFAPSFTEAWLDPIAAWRDLRLYRVRTKPAKSPAPSIVLGKTRLSNSHQDFSVAANELLEFRVLASPEMGETATSIHLSWHAKDGTLLLFQNCTLPTRIGSNWHRWLQSAPHSATRVRAYTAAPQPGIELEVRRLLPAAHAQEGL